MSTSDLAVELYTGPPTGWVRGSVYTRSSVTINRGTSDESTSAVPSESTFQLNNKAPDASGSPWSPRNPTGPYFGQIGPGTPERTRPTRPATPERGARRRPAAVITMIGAR